MQARLASAFLKAEGAQEGPLKDFFFTQADFPDPESSSVSSQTALRYLRGSLHHAVAVAGNREIDPEVLRRFAKDPRVSVRHAALLNPSMPTDALLYLLKWMFRHRTSDHLALSAQIWRLSASQLADLSEDLAEHRFSGVSISDENLRRLALKLAASREDFARARTSAFANLDLKMAHLAISGSLHGVTLAEVFEKAGARFSADADTSALRHASDLVRDLIADSGMITHELLDLWDGTVPMQRHYRRPASPAVLVESGVLERLADGPPPYLELAVLNRAPEKLVAARIPSADMTVMSALCSMLGSGYLSASSERKLAERLLQMAAEDPDGRSRDSLRRFASSLVLLAQSPLPEDLLLGVLRLGDAGVTADWLMPRESRHSLPGGVLITARCSQPVSASLLRRLGEDSGSALERHHAGYQRLIGPGAGWEILTTQLLHAASDSAEIGAAVVELLGEQLTGRHLTFGKAASALYPYIREVIGEDMSRWSTFLTLAADWEGALGDLLEASDLLVHS